MAKQNNDNLRDLLNKIAKEKGYINGHVDVQDISSEGANYSSTLHLATISGPPKEDLKLFVKVACVGEALRSTGDMFTKAFDTERVFYSELAVAYERLYDNHGVTTNDRLYIPKYYGHDSTNNRETLVIENLTASGFDSFDRFKCFDWDYASAAIAELAKFHALGIAVKVENYTELDSIRKIGMDTFAIENMKEVFIRQAMKLGKETIKEEYRARIQKYLTEENLLHDMAILWKTFDAGFLIHADYRPSNLMHRRKDGRVQVVPVDFQTLHSGPLVADLLYFIWCGSDSKFRQKHYQQLLELYYSELTTALNNLRISIDEVYPRKTFEKELEDSKTLGLMLGLSMMSILTVEPENAPKMETMESFAFAPNQLALKKINEVVEDYIRWEII